MLATPTPLFQVGDVVYWKGYLKKFMSRHTGIVTKVISGGEIDDGVVAYRIRRDDGREGIYWENQLKLLARGEVQSQQSERSNVVPFPLRKCRTNNTGKIYTVVLRHFLIQNGTTFNSAQQKLDRKSTRLNSSHSQISYA